MDTLKKILLFSIAFGIAIGAFFPIFASLFVTWKEGMLFYFVVSCILAGVVLVIINYYIFKKLLVKPINIISAEVGEIAKTGSLGKRISVKSSDEVGEMADAINDMLDNVSKPITELGSLSEKIALGDLTYKTAEINARGDVVALINAMGVMKKNLQEFILSIKEAAKKTSGAAESLSSASSKVNSTSVQVSGSMKEISESSRELSTLAAEASKTLDDMVSSLQSSLEKISVTYNASGETQKTIEAGLLSGERASLAIAEISAAAKKATEAIGGLSNMSQEISKIVVVIDSISEQTNLLALNAAIEAARAGDAGRGFAIVADEVRKLAEETKKATIQIGEIIKKMIDDTKESVEKISLVNKHVELGSATIAGLLGSLENIGKSSGEVILLVNDVAASSNKIKSGVDNVQKAMREVVAVSEKSAAKSEDVAASMQNVNSSIIEVSDSAKGLAQTAQGLKAVERFKVQD